MSKRWVQQRMNDMHNKEDVPFDTLKKRVLTRDERKCSDCQQTGFIMFVERVDVWRSDAMGNLVTKCQHHVDKAQAGI